MTTKIAKAMDIAAASLGSALNYAPDLIKASHDAMFHHAVYAAAAAKAGKMDDAAKHRFMCLRHSLENCRDKSYHGMNEAMRRNMDHYQNEAHAEVNGKEAAYGWSPVANDPEQNMSAAEKHFKKGGAFVPHPADKAFKEDYKGHKAGPKVGKK